MARLNGESSDQPTTSVDLSMDGTPRRIRFAAYESKIRKIWKSGPEEDARQHPKRSHVKVSPRLSFDIVFREGWLQSWQIVYPVRRRPERAMRSALQTPPGARVVGRIPIHRPNP